VRPCTFPGIGDGQHRTPTRGCGFPRAGARKILPRPRRTVGVKKRATGAIHGGPGREPRVTVLRVLVALVLVVSDVLVAGAAAGRRGRPATGDRSGCRAGSRVVKNEGRGAHRRGVRGDRPGGKDVGTYRHGGLPIRRPMEVFVRRLRERPTSWHSVI
jgi:hypothetical protein